MRREEGVEPPYTLLLGGAQSQGSYNCMPSRIAVEKLGRSPKEELT